MRVLAKQGDVLNSRQQTVETFDDRQKAETRFSLVTSIPYKPHAFAFQLLDMETAPRPTYKVVTCRVVWKYFTKFGKELRKHDECPACHETLLTEDMKVTSYKQMLGRPILWCCGCEEVVAQASCLANLQ